MSLTELKWKGKILKELLINVKYQPLTASVGEFHIAIHNGKGTEELDSKRLTQDDILILEEAIEFSNETNEWFTFDEFAQLTYDLPFDEDLTNRIYDWLTKEYDIEMSR